MGQNYETSKARATADVIAVLRQRNPDCVLVDNAGRSWTAEDLEYTLLDELRNKRWPSRSAATLRPDGIYSVDDKGQPGERLYLLFEVVASTST